MAAKGEQAFRTIGELADELGVPQHILRYWETRFPQLRPLQRAGNRRYYRTDDVALARRIHRLLSQEGYTIRGVQRLLGEKATEPQPQPEPQPEPQRAAPAAAPDPVRDAPSASWHPDRLRALRETLTRALEESRI
ncbi:MAG TPA: MerR family transcriptional regulator [Allosphingosinicella sp.]|jgi:DNA-binding transcriptional MerR regulator